MSSYTITGKVHSLSAETSRESNGKTYKSRDIILDCPSEYNGQTIPNNPKFTGKSDKILQQMNQLSAGQQVTLSFNIRGFNGQKGNFTALEIWKIEATAAPATPQPNNASGENTGDDGMPF